jgi:CubicO group peptidase (beta-lactamase class C family)
MTAPILPIEGYSDPRFGPVRDAFVEIFADGAEVGASLSVTIENEPVIDLWAGYADAEMSRPWAKDTIVNLYSIGKALTATCVLRLADEGRIDLDAPVARYWPEFAQGGKSGLPVRLVLPHQAGLPAIRRKLAAGTVYDWEAMTSALAGQEPWWVPGTAHGYHVNTYGFILGEIVRRASGKSLGTYFREEIAGPAGIDFHFGIGPEFDARCADVLPSKPRPGDAHARPAAPPGDYDSLEGMDRMLAGAYRNPPEISGSGVVNTRAWRACEVPSTNGHGNARAVARFYGALACDGEVGGAHILSPRWRDRAIEQQVYGDDLILGRPTRFGLGYQLTMPERRLGPNPRTFGHFGAGGALGFADPDARLGFGYAMNQGRSGWQHPHIRHLIDLVYGCFPG